MNEFPFEYNDELPLPLQMGDNVLLEKVNGDKNRLLMEKESDLDDVILDFKLYPDEFPGRCGCGNSKFKSFIHKRKFIRRCVKCGEKKSI